MKISWKNIENWRSWKMRFFWGGHFEFSKSAILIFFCFISVEKAARLDKVSFFSALWMAFPESWKRSCPNFYAPDCSLALKGTLLLGVEMINPTSIKPQPSFSNLTKLIVCIAMRIGYFLPWFRNYSPAIMTLALVKSLCHWHCLTPWQWCSMSFDLFLM